MREHKISAAILAFALEDSMATPRHHHQLQYRQPPAGMQYRPPPAGKCLELLAKINDNCRKPRQRRGKAAAIDFLTERPTRNPVLTGARTDKEQKSFASLLQAKGP